jgi:methanogenic corrinoid protein MtbC1
MTGLLQREIDYKEEQRADNPEVLELESSPEQHFNADPGVAGMLETEIIPRLVLTCRNGNEDQSSTNECGLSSSAAFASEAHVKEFAKMLIEADDEAISRHIAGSRDSGSSLDSIYLDLMGPAARRLGNLWEEDQCSIVDVTLGVGRLQQILRELSPEFQQYCGLPNMRRRALLLPAPGENHSFGLSLLMDFFRRAGWDLWGWPLLGDDDLISLVRNEWFAVIGLSVSAQVNLSGLSKLIQDLRHVSGNPSLGIILGGPLFIRNPQLGRELGADATAIDAPQAVMQAESLLSLQ